MLLNTLRAATAAGHGPAHVGLHFGEVFPGEYPAQRGPSRFHHRCGGPGVTRSAASRRMCRSAVDRELLASRDSLHGL